MTGWLSWAMFLFPHLPFQEEPGPVAGPTQIPWPTQDTVQEEDVAFWVYLADAPERMLPITLEEWDGYARFRREITPPTDEGEFVMAVLRPILEVKISQLYYHEEIPSFLERVEKVIEELEKGRDFGRVVRRFTDDISNRRMEGRLAEHTRMQFNYPTHWKLFDHAEGTWAGPFFVQFGAEFYWIDRKTGPETVSPRQSILPQQVFIRYAPQSSTGGNEWSRVFRNVRLRSSKERFRQILPPGIQVPRPERFGPQGISPLGSPDLPLEVLSEDESLSHRPRQPQRGVR